MSKLRLATLAIALAGFAVGANAQTVVSANVTTNTTWGGAVNPSPIILQTAIFVKDGATLTILPGTIVRGQPRQNAVVPGSIVGVPGTLIVTNTGRIVANGSATNPIIFTTAATDNNADGIPDDDDMNGFADPWNPGDTFLDATPLTAPLAPLDKAGRPNVALWGSVVLLGNAPTNLADKVGVGFGKGLVEGLTVPGFPNADATYGGNEPHDNSGSLSFVSIRHAGDEIGNSNELNGITLAGVGDGTVFENIEIYCNFDDGIEWFGGTVNGKNLLVSFAGDDAFDLDEGYTGVNQFLFGIMPFFNANNGAAFGSLSGDKLGEFDGDNYRPDNIDFNDNVAIRIGVDGSSGVGGDTQAPLNFPAMYNMTLIGTTLDQPQFFTPTSPASTNRGIQVRNGYAGLVANSIVVNTGSEEGFEVAPSAPGGETPGQGVTEHANAGLILLVCSTFDDTGVLDALETTVVTNGNAFSTSLGGGAGSANVINSAAFPGLVNEDQSFDPTGNAAGKLDSSLKPVKLNPRPNAGLTGTAGCVAPQGPGLAKVTYRGAFDRTASTLWTTGWTALNRGGLLAD